MEFVDAIDVAIQRSHQRVLLRAILHSVLFHRALGPITTTTEDILGCQVVTVQDRDVSTYVNTKVESYWQRCNTIGKYSGQVAIVFSQRRSKKSWFTSHDESIPFEAHIITLSEPVSTGRYDMEAEARSKNELGRALEEVLRFCVEKNNHIPAISSGTAQFPFPYEIIIDPPSPSHIFTTSFEPISSPPPTSGIQTRSRGDNVDSFSASPTTTTTAATATGGIEGYGTPRPRRESDTRPGTTTATNAALGYLESARGGLMAVGGKVGGAVGGWSGKS